MTADTATAEARSGEYTALCALSVGRITVGKEGDRRADIVMPGETLHLTDDEAAYLANGHRVPVIARKGTQGRRVIARQLMNPMRPASAFGAFPEEAVKGDVTVLDGTADPVTRQPEATLSDPGEVDPDFGAENQKRRGRPPRQS